jgi:hypothetical protein
MHHILRNIRATIWIFIAFGIFSSCSSGLFTYRGAVETQKDRIIALDTGNHPGIWTTNELSITYQYQLTTDLLKIEGNTELFGGFATDFRWIKRLAIYLLFLDKQGIVIDSPLVYSIGTYRAVDMIPMKFERTIPVPEGVCAFSFAYDGELSGTGTDDAIPYSIWHTPSRP